MYLRYQPLCPLLVGWSDGQSGREVPILQAPIASLVYVESSLYFACICCFTYEYMYYVQRVRLFSPGAYRASAREVEGQQFFLALTLFRVSVGLIHDLFFSPHSPPCSSLSTSVKKINTYPADGSIRSRLKLVDTPKIFWSVDLGKQSSYKQILVMKSSNEHGDLSCCRCDGQT